MKGKLYIIMFLVFTIVGMLGNVFSAKVLGLSANHIDVYFSVVLSFIITTLIFFGDVITAIKDKK